MIEGTCRDKTDPWKRDHKARKRGEISAATTGYRLELDGDSAAIGEPSGVHFRDYAGWSKKSLFALLSPALGVGGFHVLAGEDLAVERISNGFREFFLSCFAAIRKGSSRITNIGIASENLPPRQGDSSDFLIGVPEIGSRQNTQFRYKREFVVAGGKDALLIFRESDFDSGISLGFAYQLQSSIGKNGVLKCSGNAGAQTELGRIVTDLGDIDPPDFRIQGPRGGCGGEHVATVEANHCHS
jgi:hypothetical protein